MTHKKVTIRNVPTSDLIELDLLAKQSKKSRDKYLRDLIHQHTKSPHLMIQANDYGLLVDECLTVIKKNSTLVNELLDLLKGEEYYEI